MNGQNQKLNYRYRCKINDINYNIQLFNIQQEKIKIMIDTKNAYSDEYIEYSNIYSLIQFQEISRYFALFENLQELFEDLCRTIQQRNFSISHNGRKMTLTIKIIINKNEKDVNFILDKSKTIDLSSQKDPFFYNYTSSSRKTNKNKSKPFSLEKKSKRNIDISNINELNTLLNNFKDRITILETNQNNPSSPRNNIINAFENNDNISFQLENILLRLIRLENENNNKDKKIKKLEQKLRFYESIDNNNKNIDKNNNYHKYSMPTYPNNFVQNRLSIGNFYNNSQLQTQRQLALTFNKNDNTNRSEIYINDNNDKKNTNYHRLKQSKSEILKNSNNYNNENMSFYSKDTNKNNYYRNNSYNDKKTSRENNQSYPDKYNNSSANEINSSNFNNSNPNSSISNYSMAKDKYFKKYVKYKEKLGIPIVPREDLKKFINSRIIFTKNELKLLKVKLSGGNKKLHVFFDLLYRASLDGEYEEIIKENIINKEKTLTLFYTYEGSRFGVYINQEKSFSFLQGEIYKEVPGTSFIVSLNNLIFFDIFPNKTSKDGFEDYLSFGRTYYLNENGTNWLIYTPSSKFLKKRCIIGNQKGNYIDYDPEILIGNKSEYHLKDVEIFEVVFEKDEDFKKEKNKI